MVYPLPDAAKSGFADSASYDQHRPSYPLEAVSSFLHSLGIEGAKGARILEIGAGTGKFTELLAAREEGYEITAVEPHPDMRAELAQKQLPGVKVIQGAAEEMSVSNHWAEAVVVAQVAAFPKFQIII